MSVAGLDLHISDMPQSGKVSILAGSLGVIVPFGLGAGLSLVFRLGTSAALFIELILSATSVSISAQTLLELKVLRSRVGVGLLGAAVFDDILVVLGVSIFLALAQPDSGSGLASILIVLLRMLLYLLVAGALGL